MAPAHGPTPPLPGTIKLHNPVPGPTPPLTTCCVRFGHPRKNKNVLRLGKNLRRGERCVAAQAASIQRTRRCYGRRCYGRRRCHARHRGASPCDHSNLQNKAEKIMKTKFIQNPKSVWKISGENNSQTRKVFKCTDSCSVRTISTEPQRPRTFCGCSLWKRGKRRVSDVTRTRRVVSVTSRQCHHGRTTRPSVATSISAHRDSRPHTHTHERTHAHIPHTRTHTIRHTHTHTCALADTWTHAHTYSTHTHTHTHYHTRTHTHYHTITYTRTALCTS